MSTQTTPFWTEDPTILLNNDQLFQLWPSSDMTLEEKLNAVSRIVILLTLFTFVLKPSTHTFLVGILAISILVVFYYYKKKSQGRKNDLEEGFVPSKDISSRGGGEKVIQAEELKPFVKSQFKVGNKKNPFSNVLLTEITDDPKRKSAPPSFQPEIDQDITNDTKKLVQQLNPGIKNTNKQLFSSLTDNFDLDQSMRVFNTTPNSRVANDQGAFAKFLYGDMPSAKESNTEGNLQRYADSYRYTLY